MLTFSLSLFYVTGECYRFFLRRGWAHFKPIFTLLPPFRSISWRAAALFHCCVISRKSDNEIGRPHSGTPICLSRVWLQTELDDAKSYYQLIIKITISEKRWISKLWKKGKIYIKKTDKGDVNILRSPRLQLVIRRQKHKSKGACTHSCTYARNHNFEYDWLI